MFEQTFKNIDDVLWKDAGCTSELDYTEQSSWILFLKYLDALERDKATEALLEGREYSYILEEPYRWERWAAPKTIAYPPTITVQSQVATRLNELYTETQRLESIYQQKPTAFDEPKKSILHQAFAGELATLPDKQLDEALT